ncbi:helix-turn-helix domain-containing protein [Streptomyces sp. NBC_00887]|uniref:nSTAND1 domain-containing NTPase n=1 Tax=Streptomyces sp. NBC_00887 TaxID=2975859 RepID=UPI002F9151CB|nr:helix-turn-helix domain-containing protein [Streptomyces sp. NBC_00887]
MAGRREVPVDPEAGPVQRFAFELRKLRDEAGGITYRVLAERAGYSVTTLSQAASGEQLPTLPVVLAYVAACGGDAVEWEARWKQAVEETAAGLAEEGEGGESPYRGLARFETGDSARFFGRARLTADLLDLLRGRRFAAVFGPSGSGKSSLLRAGLIPALQNSQDASLRPAAIRILTPGERPARAHAHLLDPTGTGPDSAGADTLVIVDQFEEVFTLCQDSAERARFLDLLLTARTPGSRLRVLIAVRADFYGRCAEHRDLADALGDANVLAGPMSPAELREAIVKPAAADGLTVERALAARLVTEVTDAPGGLPLLSHVLLETWRRRRGKTLTLDGYEAAGALDGAIAKTAEDLYNQFTQPQAAAARRVLLRLVAPGDGTPDTRRPADRTELQDTGQQDIGPVIEALATARLLTLDHDTVEIAHEALLTAWPRLRGWIEEDRERLRTHRKLTEAARAWEELGREAGALYRGSRLATAQEHFSGAHPADLTDLEQAFLTAGLSAREQEERAAARTTRRLRTLSATLSVFLVLAVTAGLIAWNQSRVSDRQRQAANTAQQVALSRQLAAQSASLIGTNSDLASLLAIRAYQSSPTSQAVESLNTAATMPLQRRITAYPGSAVVAVTFSPDGHTLATIGDSGTRQLGSSNAVRSGSSNAVRLWDTSTGRLRQSLPPSTGSVKSVAFNPDGQTLATGGEHGVQLWNADTGSLRRSFGARTLGTVSVAFSPDGHTLATARADNTVQLWNADTGSLRRDFGPRTFGTVSVAFSPDGHTLANAPSEGMVQLWNADTGSLRRSLGERTTGTVSVVFSPDGHTLATAPSEGMVQLWNADTGSLRRSLGERTTSIVSMAFSPDSRSLATGGGQDRTARLWDVSTGGALTTLAGHSNTVLSMTFSPDGRSLATGSADQTVRLWDMTASQAQAVLSGPHAAIASVAFSPDGRTLASASNDGIVRLWNTANGRIRGRLAKQRENVDFSMVVSVAFSPDGHTLATAFSDGMVQLWDADTGTFRTSLGNRTSGTMASVAFSPDGHTLATGGGDDHTVRLWDTDTGRLLKKLHGHSDTVLAVAFSPDGHTLATGGQDRRVRLWDARTGHHRTDLSGHTNPMFSLAFSPDGRTLATAPSDGMVQLWDADTGRLRRSLPGRTSLVFFVAFSPDGRTLATASSDDHTVRLWDAATGGILATLAGHTDAVLAMAFSPDGRTLATGSADQTTRLWNVALPTPDAAISKICRTVNRDLTAQERSVYLPDQPPHTPCPN